MYLNPTLFPAISNREGWIQTVKITDDDTGDAVALTDANNNPVVSINLEISESSISPPQSISPYYDDWCAPIITGTLANYITIVDTGTIQIIIPKSVIQTLPAPRTYNVYLTVDQVGADDGRQLLIGRLPVLYGGRNT